MKSFYIFLISVLLLSCSDNPNNKTHSETDFSIIPKPNSINISKGGFQLKPNTVVYYGPYTAEEGDYITELLGIKKELVHLGNEKNKYGIHLLMDPKVRNPEGYILSVKPDGIKIYGGSPKGVFYGIQSLRQLLPPDIENGISSYDKLIIPTVEIQDSPRYSYRGMHLDVGRHFFPVKAVKKYIDMIAMHKMNTFHWHLTEDQGWRIEIKKYPKLTEIGAFRKGTAIGLAGTKNAPYTYDTIPHGGFYTQEEIKEVVRYASDRHVTIIPEIELPGHSLAALTAYPEFGNTGGPYEVAKRWGIFKDIYAPTEETFTFLEDVLAEVMELFPGTYIHIGGDEVLKDEWKASAYAQDLIKREGLKDEEGLQSYFIKRIETFLNDNDRDMIGWDEILEGGLAPNATVMSWRGTEGGIAAAKQGHRVIMTPGTHCYFDYYQIDEEGQKNEPITGSKRFTTVKKVYSYEPTPTGLSPKEAEYILGAQGNVWTEYMPTWDRVEYKVLPRMTALSEVLWSSKEARNWDDFQGRLQIMAKRFDVLGYNYARYSLNNDSMME